VITIVLPWPDKRLTPNAKRRKHWTVYNGAVKADRASGHLYTTLAVPLASKRALAAVAGKIALTVTFYPPDNRRRDDDGMVSAFKHMRDGIADALGVDDHKFRASYVVAEAAKPGRVEVMIP
jgi:crossover junction endodeoxyribonuclease RusA